MFGKSHILCYEFDTLSSTTSQGSKGAIGTLLKLFKATLSTSICIIAIYYSKPSQVAISISSICKIESRRWLFKILLVLQIKSFTLVGFSFTRAMRNALVILVTYFVSFASKFQAYQRVLHTFLW
jgi:hypothetical protein